MIEIAFWILAGLLVYIYFGYPAILFVLSRFSPAHAYPSPGELPRVTLLISAYNEEDCIEQKLENSLTLDYPADKLDIVVISDQSSDDTDAIVQRFVDRGVRLLRMEDRGGKTLGLNAGVAESSADIVVFSDANAMYRGDAVKKLVAPFAAPDVGAVIGESTYADVESDAGESESLYWRYETAIKVLESRISSVVGGDGAIYAVRRSLYRPMDADVLSDFVNPLQVVEQGYRCLYEPDAISVEEAAGTYEKEFKRKTRIVNRAWRATMNSKRLLNPLRHGVFAWQLVSHKLLRWLAPVFLAMLCVTNIMLLNDGSVYVLAFLLQVLLYTLAVIGALLRSRENVSPVFYVPYYFCLVNWASARGILEAYAGKTYTTWSTARQ